MKFFAALALISGAIAGPIAARHDSPCPDGLYSVPVCAAVDVLHAACLDAYVLPETPDDCDTFDDICASRGQQARCAAIPILGQALLCIEPTRQF